LAKEFSKSSSPENISTEVKLMPAEDEFTQLFQDWFFGKMHPREFSRIWGTITYKEIGLLCGVSETTVARWAGNQSAKFHYAPPDRCQRLLAFIHCWLIIFEMTPAELISQFEQELRQ
jgi:hypothetical protein